LPLAAIISDTHLPRRGRQIPTACWRRLRGADLIIHAGDFSTLDVLEQLRGTGPPLVAVRGNVDDSALRALLPARAQATLDGVHIGVTHDAGAARGRLARLRKLFPECAAVVYGHSHIPLHEEREGFQIFNPGSPTDRRRQPRHTMGMALVQRGCVTFRIIALDA